MRIHDSLPTPTLAVLQRNLRRRLRSYYRQIARINDIAGDLATMADELASDIGDDLLFINHEVEQLRKTIKKKPKRPFVVRRRD